MELKWGSMIQLYDHFFLVKEAEKLFALYLLVVIGVNEVHIDTNQLIYIFH